MLDITNLRLEDLDKLLLPLQDDHLVGLKKSWYNDPQQSVGHNEFIDRASSWFKETKINNLEGWDKFPCIDIIMG